MTHVAVFNGTNWPAWKRPDGLLVDLRLFPEGAAGQSEELTYLPEKLRACGVPENIIASAAESDPKGFVLMAN